MTCQVIPSVANEGGIKAICKLNRSFVIENTPFYVIFCYLLIKKLKRGSRCKYKETADTIYSKTSKNNREKPKSKTKLAMQQSSHLPYLFANK